MINLIKIELKKIFHKKGIYVIFILMAIFCLLNNILYWKDYDEDGNYKYLPQENLKQEEIKLQQELKKYDVTKKSDTNMYLAIKTKLDIVKLKRIFPTNSWQYRKINDYLYEAIYEINTYTYANKDTNLAREATKKYQTILTKLKQDDWKYFIKLEKNKLEEEQEKLQKRLISIEDKQLKSDLEFLLLENKQNLEILKYRLRENVKEDTSYLNTALETYQENLKTINHYEKSNHKKSYTKDLEYRKAFSNLKVNQYILEHKQNINKQNNLSYQLRTIVEDYEIFIIIIVLMISSTILCDEFKDGTIKLLLIKPHSRGKILLSKYLTSLLVILISILYLILLQLLVGGIIFGFSSLKIPVVVYHYGIHEIKTYSVFIYMIIRILAKLPFLIILFCLGMFISIVSTNTVITIIIPLMLYMFNPALQSIAVQYHLKFMRFAINMNWNFQDYLFGGIPDFSYINFGFSTLIWISYFLLLGILTFIIFQKKNIKNI